MDSTAITLTRSDPAALNMLDIFRQLGFIEYGEEQILRRHDTYLIVIDDPIVPTEEDKVAPGQDPYPLDYDDIAKKLNIDYYVVASRYTARSGKPSLTVHATGNFSDADFGDLRKNFKWFLPMHLETYPRSKKSTSRWFLYKS